MKEPRLAPPAWLNCGAAHFTAGSTTAFGSYSRPYKQRLTEKMLKELEKKLREEHAAWTEDNLWNAFATARPGKVKGRSQTGRFADLVSLVRFSLEQQPVLEPFAESVNERFNEWLMDKAKAHAASQPSSVSAS